MFIVRIATLSSCEICNVAPAQSFVSFLFRSCYLFFFFKNTKIDVRSFYLAAMIDICPQQKKGESQNETTTPFHFSF